MNGALYYHTLTRHDDSCRVDSRAYLLLPPLKLTFGSLHEMYSTYTSLRTAIQYLSACRPSECTVGINQTHGSTNHDIDSHYSPAILKEPKKGPGRTVLGKQYSRRPPHHARNKGEGARSSVHGAPPRCAAGSWAGRASVLRQEAGAQVKSHGLRLIAPFFWKLERAVDPSVGTDSQVGCVSARLPPITVPRGPWTQPPAVEPPS